MTTSILQCPNPILTTGWIRAWVPEPTTPLTLFQPMLRSRFPGRKRGNEPCTRPEPCSGGGSRREWSKDRKGSLSVADVRAERREKQTMSTMRRGL